MESATPVRYASADGADIAYQVFGTGGIDIVAIPPMAQNIELTWERAEYRAMFERMGRFGRILHFDKRGTGASDRTAPVPSLDTRVDDVRAVMDAAGVERAYLHGVSEGGPLAILFAATYPERVRGLVLHATAASLRPRAETDDERTERRRRWDVWIERWGTDDTLTLDVFSPTAAADPTYRAWEPRYERQSATRTAVRDLIDMVEEVDVGDLLDQVAVPTLVVHRTGDRVVPVAEGRRLAAAIPGARLVEVPGDDHFAQVGPLDPWLDAVERFVTGGAPGPRGAPRPPAAAASPGATIRVLGGFAVGRDGVDVPTSAWGSRRARLLCKRLATAAPDEPVPREHLMDLLWPDETDLSRLGARLSVQLSTVRRVLGGGVVADRDAIRIDRRAVRIDLDVVLTCASAGDDAGAVEHYAGELLPEDPDAPWAEAPRQRARAAFLASARRLGDSALGDGDHRRAVELSLRVLEVDPFDDDAHRRLVRALADGGQHGEARRSYQRYVEAMASLGVEPTPLESVVQASIER